MLLADDSIIVNPENNLYITSGFAICETVNNMSTLSYGFTINNNLGILIEMEEGHEEIRVRMPKKGEILGIIESIVGGSRMRVRCSDGKPRMCRIPGRFRKSMWVREGDAVLIVPWPIQGDTNADIIWKYTPTQAYHLRKKNLLNF